MKKFLFLFLTSFSVMFLLSACSDSNSSDSNSNTTVPQTNYAGLYNIDSIEAAGNQIPATGATARISTQDNQNLIVVLSDLSIGGTPQDFVFYAESMDALNFTPTGNAGQYQVTVPMDMGNATVTMTRSQEWQANNGIGDNQSLIKVSANYGKPVDTTTDTLTFNVKVEHEANANAEYVFDLVEAAETTVGSGLYTDANVTDEIIVDAPKLVSSTDTISEYTLTVTGVTNANKTYFLVVSDTDTETATTNINASMTLLKQEEFLTPDLSNPESLQGKYDVEFFATKPTGLGAMGTMSTNCAKAAELGLLVPTDNKTANYAECKADETDNAVIYGKQAVINYNATDGLILETKLQIWKSIMSLSPDDAYQYTKYSAVMPADITSEGININNQSKGVTGRNLTTLTENPESTFKITKMTDGALYVELELKDKATLIGNVDAPTYVILRKTSNISETVNPNSLFVTTTGDAAADSAYSGFLEEPN